MMCLMMGFDLKPYYFRCVLSIDFVYNFDNSSVVLTIGIMWFGNICFWEGGGLVRCRAPPQAHFLGPQKSCDTLLPKRFLKSTKDNK